MASEIHGWYQALKVSAQGEIPFNKGLAVTSEEASGWERMLNETRTAEEIEAGISYKVVEVPDE